MTTAKKEARDQTSFDYWCAEHLEDIETVRRSSRGAGSAAGFDPAAYHAADVLSVHFADGSVFHTQPDRFAAEYAIAPRMRGAEPVFDRPERVVLPFEFDATSHGTRSSASQAQVDHYVLARLTEPSTLDRLYKAGALVADGLDRWFGSAKLPLAAQLAGKLCRAYENACLHDAVGESAGALLRWGGQAWAPVDASGWDGASAARSVVLFLHGTASSTQGSFKALWAPDPKREAISPEFAALAQRHELLAWEHRSLTASPLLNAIGLLQQLGALLPQGCTVHIVSHSRGGMIGELLSLGFAATSDGQASSLLRTAREAFDRAYGRDHPDIDHIGSMFEQMAKVRHLEPGVFVRVACPARGTLLADRRTDLFLSMLLRSAGLALGTNGVPMWERLNSLVRSLVAARADARSLPGLEAMIPGSPLTIVLNTTTLKPIGGKLRVIAGDTHGLGWGGILTFLGDVFYGMHDHDFVVHTHSMFGGFLREDARSLRVEDRSVSHFGYFTTSSLTRQPLFAALEGRDEGFRPMHDDERQSRGVWQALGPARLSRRSPEESIKVVENREAASASRAILVVLPGIMGSELSRPGPDETLVWLSIASIAMGRLGDLNLKSQNALRASGLTPLAYERLLLAAEKSFDVVPFAYDWRHSLQDSGQQLYELLDRLQSIDSRQRVPIHILAHSMGGLVARSALFRAQGRELWTQLRARGSRLLMLGTPNTGSYAPVQLFTQHHALSSLLATIAPTVSTKKLASWSGKYQGLLEMLPKSPDPTFGDLYQPRSWRAISEAHPRTSPPSETHLIQARNFREEMDSHLPTLINDPNVLYVAGMGITPVALSRVDGASEDSDEESDGKGTLRYRMEMQGDGTVPWSGALGRERTWYAQCTHGDLADDRDSFEAYFDLLTTGRTSKLSRTQPVSTERSSRETNTRVARPAQTGHLALPSLPAEPLAYVLGLARTLPGGVSMAPIEVRVVHGSLDYARYPLIVGHYQNDRLFGGAKRIDEKLSGQLSRLLDMKLFSGAALTCAYLRPETRDATAPAYAGAVLVGLGMIGELTPGSLADTVTRGVLRYAFEHLHRDPWVPPEGVVRLRFSTLLIGTHVQAVTSRDSLAGVLQGIWRAGHHLAQEGTLGRRVEITEVEVIEIQEDVALDAAYEMRHLVGRQEWAARFVWHKQLLETRDGGLRGYRPGNNDAVWQRLIARHEETGGLKFELIAERARVESTRVYSDVASLSRYIAQVSDEGASGHGNSVNDPSLGRVLYQLLLPQALKGRLLNFDNTVLVVDDKSAAYPWELLTPPEDGLIGDRVRPLSVQAGMVRQRLTYEFRNLPQSTGGWNALVVGAPGTMGWTDAKGTPLDFQSLPGAEQEARQVIERLEADGRAWNCTALQGADISFEKVRTAILERPYRIMHLAGHGVVDQWIQEIGDGPLRQQVRKTGMVLSHQQVLSAGEVEQIDPVPEFVFINCCYSGRDGDQAAAIGQRNYPVLAAGLAMQFIKMGAQAVVAAGWQVDDRDGLHFAGALYRELLAGVSFGAAVRTARESIFPANAREGSNTWGAYQCYGDPDWRLPDGEQRTTFGQAYGTSRLRNAAQCMSHHEFSERVLQLTAVAGDKSQAAMLMQLDELLRNIAIDPRRSEWLKSSRVRAAVGEAFRELGDHARAVEWMQRGARTAYSHLQMRHIELMVDSLSRLRDPAHHDRALKILDHLEAIDAEELLIDSVRDEALGTDGAVRAMSERECLRGSDLLHRAIESPPAKQADLLLQAGERFAQGYLAKLEPADRVDRRAYALSSTLLCIGLAGISGADHHRCEQVAQRLQQVGDGRDARRHAQALLDEIDARGMTNSFWHYTASFELLVARNVFGVAAGESANHDELRKARSLLQTAMVRWPSPAERESIARRFRAIEQVCASSALPKDFFAPVLQTATECLAEMDRPLPGGS